MTPGSSVQNSRLTSILRRGLAARLWLENSSDAATKRDGSWRIDRNCSGPEPAAAADSPAAVTLAKVSDIAAARNALQSRCRSARRQGGGCCTKTSLHDPMILAQNRPQAYCPSGQAPSDDAVGAWRPAVHRFERSGGMEVAPAPGRVTVGQGSPPTTWRL